MMLTTIIYKYIKGQCSRKFRQHINIQTLTSDTASDTVPLKNVGMGTNPRRPAPYKIEDHIHFCSMNQECRLRNFVKVRQAFFRFFLLRNL